MKHLISFFLTTLTLVLFFTGCHVPREEEDAVEKLREDNAEQLDIKLSGSLQNPTFSPDGKSILFTRYNDGYNEGQADIYKYDLETEDLKLMVYADNMQYISNNGTSWNGEESLIVFASANRIYKMDDSEVNQQSFITNPIFISDQINIIELNPTLDTNATQVVYELHPTNIENNGTIVLYDLDQTTEPILLTEESVDARQPNFSPNSKQIVFQQYSDEQWHLWLMDVDGANKVQLTEGEHDNMDASFYPTNTSIIFSSDRTVSYGNLYRYDINSDSTARITQFSKGYDGMPSISPDGTQMVFESCEGSPTNSKTVLFLKAL